MVRAKTPPRTILVTDATTAAGRPPGDYMLGSLRVHLDETGRVAVPGQPNLAGSALSMDRAIGNTVRFTGLPLADRSPHGLDDAGALSRDQAPGTDPRVVG